MRQQRITLCKFSVIIIFFCLCLFLFFYKSSVYASSLPLISNPKFINDQEVEIKVKPGVVINQNNKFSSDNAQSSSLNSLLSTYGYTRVRPIINPSLNLKPNAVTKALSGYYDVYFSSAINVKDIVSKLSNSPQISQAYPVSMPAPPPSVPDFTSLQRYLSPAPTGVDENFAATYPGGLGQKTRIVDIEYSWNTDHVNLPSAKNALVDVGTPVDPFNDNNHGTAVLGEMISANLGYGVIGVSSDSNIRLINTDSTQNGWDIPESLAVAASITKPGDVILIEQQVYGPDANSDFVPVEWVPAIYSAIKALTTSGRIVVEPAANGSQDLDTASLYGKPFPMGKPNSGAIIVGAGENCTGSINPLLSLLSISNYGSRVNLQGPGDCVVTTGYGDLYDQGGVNEYYTGDFNGTSSASPVVAAAAADLSSAYISAYLTPPSPASILNLLIRTGTPQNTAVSGHIGPYPNLAAALPKTNSGPPTTPSDITAKLLISRLPLIMWKSSVSKSGIEKYVIYRNGIPESSTSRDYFIDFFASKNNTYIYRVRAINNIGDSSNLSAAVQVTVP